MTIAITKRNKLTRKRNRGNYERNDIYAVLDEAKICHVGFALDGQPFVIPMVYGRMGDDLLIHGTVGSRLLQRAAQGIELCVEVTLVDGLVLARSAMHHSLNYRSVMIFGKAQLITDYDEKWRAFDVLVDHIIPGRSQACRPSNDKEGKATHMLKLPIAEASLKARSGPPVDAEEDLALDYWAGVIPVHTVYGEPEPVDDLSVKAKAPQMG